MFDLRNAVYDLLLLEVDALLEGDRPDAVMDYTSHRASRRFREEEMVEQQWLASLEHEERRVVLARSLYRRYLRSALRFDLSLIPADLRGWANKQLQRAKAAYPNAKRRQGAELARVFVYLVIKDTVAWASDHIVPVTLDSLVTESFGDARTSGEYDGGPVVDDRPVHVAGVSYRFRAVA